MNKRQKPEAKFLGDLRVACKNLEMFYFKIPDMPHLPGMTSFDTKKPFDCVIAWEGCKGAVAVEAKAMDRIQTFSIAALRPSQVAGLEAFDRCSPGRAWVMVAIRVKRDYEKDTPAENRVMIINWQHLREKKRFMKREVEKLAFHSGTPKGLVEMLRFFHYQADNHPLSFPEFSS